MEFEFVTFDRWNSYARRVERKMLNEHGRSLTAASISNRMKRNFIHEVRGDMNGMLVRPGWQSAMQTVADEAGPHR